MKKKALLNEIQKLKEKELSNKFEKIKIAKDLLKTAGCLLEEYELHDTPYGKVNRLTLILNF